MTSSKRRRLVLISMLALLAAYWLYTYSPRKIEFLGHYDKVGAHRVNDGDKLASALCFFDAIELDLVHLPASNTLDIHHPPAPATGFTLSEYVLDLKTVQPFLWLDIKNLDETNAQVILDNVNEAFETINYPKEKVLIETRFPEALPMFTTAGYKTSYYLPQHLYTLSDTTLRAQIDSIKKVLTIQPEVAISSSYKDYDVIKKYFPDTPKYFWSNGHSPILDFGLLRNMLKDPNVKIVLATYRTF